VYGTETRTGALALCPERVEAFDLDDAGSLAVEVALSAPPGARVQAILAPAGGLGAKSLTNAVRIDRLPPPGSDVLAQGMAQTGELLITEFMKDPTVVADNRGEWIELYNPGPLDIDVTGWVLSDLGTDIHTIVARQPVVARAGEFLLLANNDDPFTNGLLIPDYRYLGTVLSNGADEIILQANDDRVVDMVMYDDGVSWPDSAGRSISLDPSAFDAVLNDDPAWWCHTDSVIHRNNSDRGTPRRSNEPCP
jgi:hypothetical protein